MSVTYGKFVYPNLTITAKSISLLSHKFVTHRLTSVVFLFRYDARLLLDTLPKPGESTVQPDSPSGWSDLPSDTEDTFFFTPDETEDFRRAKRRRLIEQTREERLRARMEEDDVEEENLEEEDIWGGSDEEVRYKNIYN